MRAIVQDRYGSADALKLRDIDPPAVTEHQVRVRVHAAGVDRGVWHLMTGLPYLTRLVYGLRRPRTPVPGTDLAGAVAAVGTSVTRFAPGDQVFGTGTGTFAEYAVAAESTLAHKPLRATFAEAASLPVTGLTALQAVRDRGRVRPGQQVLILGASGGVGTVAVQLAAARGAVVTGVASTAKLDLVRSLGARHAIDYTRQDVTDRDDRYDVILDAGGRTPLSELRRILAADGTLVIIGGEGGDRWIGGTHRQIAALLWSPFTRQSLGTFVSSANADDLSELAHLTDVGALTPSVDRAFPLEDAATALRHLANGHARGKVVLTVGPPAP